MLPLGALLLLLVASAFLLLLFGYVVTALQQGNRHFQAQEYQQAAAAYSQALALGAGDNSLTAVLLCNRAATQHAAGQFLDAIADCCLAHQLDPKYPRALQVGSNCFGRGKSCTSTGSALGLGCVSRTMLYHFDMERFCVQDILQAGWCFCTWLHHRSTRSAAAHRRTFERWAR